MTAPNNSNNVTRDELFALGSKLEQQMSVQTQILVNLATFETKLEERDKLMTKVVVQQDMLQESLQKLTVLMAKAMGGVAVIATALPYVFKYFTGA